MTPTDASEQLYAHASALREAALDENSVRAAQTFILDSFGVALAGHRGVFAAELIKTAANWGEGEAAAVWGTRQRLPAQHAAMVNAYLIHNQEFDCVHEAAVVHPMAVILASLSALAERENWSCEQLLRGVVIGVDIAATLGMAARERLKFFRPAQCGAFGAVIAACTLLGMDTHGIRNACGILLGQLSGTMQAHSEGAPLLPMQIAFNARNAVTSVDLACAGLSGPKQAIEGIHGYLNLFEGKHDLPAALASLTPGIRIREVSHKPFPSGRATHGGLDALQRVLRSRALTSNAIARIVLLAPPLVCQLIARPAVQGMSSNYAKLCFAWCAAVMVQRGALGISAFEPEALDDAALLTLAQRIQVLSDQNPNPNALSPVCLQVYSDLGAHSGEPIIEVVDAVLGSPNNPLSRAAHLEKFLANWALRSHDTQAAQRFVSAIDALALQGPVRALLAKLPGAP